MKPSRLESLCHSTQARRARPTAALLAFSIVLLGGCGSSPKGAADGGVTYWASVAPIINDKCVKCHQEGGIAPIRLDSYAAVKANGRAIAAATAAGRMPPFLLTHDGTCGDYEDSETLTVEQLATLSRWADSEMTEGVAVDLTRPATPGLDGGLVFRTPTLAPQAQGGSLAEFDEYRCFPADDKLDRDSFITGYEVLPGNAAMVHHLVAFLVDPTKVTHTGKTNQEVMTALDQRDPDRIGWPCFGMAGEGVELESVPVVWAPGQGPVKYPAGLGVQQKKRDKLVLQLHYNLVDPRVRGQTDSTSLRLLYSDTVERRAIFLFVDPLISSLEAGKPITIPPGAASSKMSWTLKGSDLGLGPLPYVDLMGVMPHMHQRGRQSRVELVSGSGNTCLARVDRWDFNWQKFYFARGTPTRLTGSSELKVSCDFDTSADTAPIFPGWGTRNEMCLSVLMLALPPGI